MTTVEYGLIIAGVGIAAIAGIFALRNAFTTTFNETLQGNGVRSCAPNDTNCTAYNALPAANIPPGSTAPTVTSVGPAMGPIAGGTTVVVSGTGFAANATASFGGSSCAVSGTPTPTSLTCVTSAHAAGTVNVVVTNPTDSLSGTLTNGFTYQGSGPVAPTVGLVTPASGPVGGSTTITVSGSGFAANSTVTVGGINCAVSGTPTATSLVCVTGAAGSAGLVNVVVTNPTDSLSGTLTDGFRYTDPAPTVSGITPATGPTAGGTDVTITGTGFAPNATASLGGSACAVTGSTSATTLTCTTSSHATGQVDVVVTNPTDSLSGTLTNGFTYANAAPSVTAIAPATGPLAGGTDVTITGTGFAANATVSIGGSACAVTGTTTATTLTCTTGSRSDDAQVNVVVTNPSDSLSGTLTDGFTYLDPTCAASEILVSGACTSTPPITICYKIKKQRTGDFAVLTGYTYGVAPFAVVVQSVTLPGAKQSDTLIRFTSPDSNSGSTSIPFTFSVTYPSNGGSEEGTGTGSLRVSYTDPSNSPVLTSCP